MNGRKSMGFRAERRVESPSKSSRSRDKSKATISIDENASRASDSMSRQSTTIIAGTSEDAVEGARSVLLAEKQAQLQEIFDRHDDMLRELYHLFQYKLMLSYEPQSSKSENTTAFTEWKAKYDLLEKVGPEAGPSRRTRGTRSEQLSMVSDLPLLSAKISPTSTSRIVKNKLSGAAIQEIMTAVAGKMHDKEKRADQEKHGDADKVVPKISIATLSVPDVSSKNLRGKGGRKVLSTIDVEKSGQISTPSNFPSPRHLSRSKGYAPIRSVSTSEKSLSKVEKRTQEAGSESISVVLGRRSTRHRGGSGLESPSKKAKIIQEMPLINVRENPLARPRAQSPKSLIKISQRKEQEAPPSFSVPEIPASTPAFKIKRIKLLVRRPPPSFTHHKQRPPPPKFGHSLSKFLTSYKTLGDEETSEENIARRALSEARIREQEADFRRQGRFIPGTDLLFGSDPNILPYDSPKRTTRDVWDDVIETISILRSKVSRKPIGQQIAAQIASKIQTYWDTQETKKDRARAQEEKRLRALAKATVKLVVADWKKAVYHIREQERLKSEAEERRRGHEHLDAILDQSGQLLETQHGNLRRARSLSNSIDIGLDGWGEDEDNEEETTEDASVRESDGEDADEMSATGEALTGSVDDEREDLEGTSALLLGPEPAAIGSLTSAEEVVNQDTEMVVEEASDSPTTSLMLGIDRTDSRASTLPPPSPIQSTDNLLLDQDMSKEMEADPLSLEASPFIEDMVDSADEPMGFLELSRKEETSNGYQLARDKIRVPSEEETRTEDNMEEEEEEEEEEDRGVTVRPQEEEEDEDEEGEEKEDKVVPNGATEDDTVAVEQPVVQDGDEYQSTETCTLPDTQIAEYLQPFAVTQVERNPEEKIKPPLLLRGILRPYQQSGLEWLASLHSNNLNGILADEMGLGKTIQTIALLAHLACDLGIWGPHLIVVPTSVLLNWEMEFKKFLPGFKVLSYHGTTKRRKELRQGWNDKYHFNVCITSYTLASRDAHIFKRKPWYYMCLDEAHMIKNFKSQRWNILLMFRSFRRLLLTGTPLQNNLTELWALLQFLMSGSNFANLKEFGDWFSNPLEKAIEMGNVLDEENMQRVSKLHTVLRPYLLRRLKRDVEKELPSKFEHLILCPLSKRQRFLYDEFMSRAQTRNDLESGIYQKIANILMQLRKVCNHPDLFEVRPIVTSFAMSRSAVVDYEIRELLVRKRWLEAEDENVNLDLLGYRFIDHQDEPLITALEMRRLSASADLPHINDLPGEPPPKDMCTIAGYRLHRAYTHKIDTILRWKHIAYLNDLKCSQRPIYSSETLTAVKRFYKPLLPFSAINPRQDFMDVVQPVHKAILSYQERADAMTGVNKFAFVTPSVVALDLPRLTLGCYAPQLTALPLEFDQILHPTSVKLQIAFPDPSLLQYDCGKLQRLQQLLQEKKAGGHRVLIFTQMTRILDILETFLNLHGYLYLRLDGATKIEDRQYITERFNADSRIFCFIASSRSGGVGINLTGADTVIFYDSDFNPQMDKQCEDRAHRIGQIRDVHIYRFVSQHTVEEAMLRKANQKRSLDDIVIQKGEFDWRTIFREDEGGGDADSGAVTGLTHALGEFEDVEDARAAALAAREEHAIMGADDVDFGAEGGGGVEARSRSRTAPASESVVIGEFIDEHYVVEVGEEEVEEEQDEEEGGTVVDYMLTFVQHDYDFFKDWRL